MNRESPTRRLDFLRTYFNIIIVLLFFKCLARLSHADAATILRSLRSIVIPLSNSLDHTIGLIAQNLAIVGRFGANGLAGTALATLKQDIGNLHNQTTVRCNAAKALGDYSTCDRPSRTPSSLLFLSVLVLISSTIC
jgi:hypothetical protein